MTDLEERLIEKEKHLKALREEEAKKTNDYNTLKTNVEKLRGERDYLHKENEKLKSKYTDENGINDFKVYKTLFQMDPQKYGQTMKDLSVSNDNIPIWANMDFLERA
jgi:chromosome segregation ATPase